MRPGFWHLIVFPILCLLSAGQIRASDQTDTSSLLSSLPAQECKFECTDSHPDSAESAQVIDTLQTLTKAYLKCDLNTCADYTDEGCTTFEEVTNKIIVGKQAVLDDLARSMEQNRQAGSPLVSYTIKEPYAKVTGNTAVVTFIAVKVFGGKDLRKYESHSSEIFMKQGVTWKRMHYWSNWKPVN